MDLVVVASLRCFNVELNDFLLVGVHCIPPPIPLKINPLFGCEESYLYTKSF